MGFLRMGVAPRKAAGGGLASVFATPFWVYSQTFFSEPLTALLGVLAWLSMIRYRSTGHLRDVFLSAVFAGLIPSIRPLGSLLIPPLLLYLLLILKTKYPSPNSRFPVRSLAVFILPIAAGILGYLAYNAVRFGNVFETGYNRLPDGSLRSFTLNPLFGLKVLLLSPGKSIFVFSPLLLLVPFGVPTLLRKKHTRTDTAVFLLITGLYLAVLSTWARVEGGVAWGPRLILPAIPFLFFCITPVLNSDRNAWRRLVILLAAVGVAIQLTGVLFNFSTYVYQHIDGYFSPVDGRYVISFNPVPGHVRSILETVSHRGSFQSRPDAQAAWNRSSEQINPMDGLDFWWLHFYRDGVPSRFIVTSLVLLGLILTTGIVLLRTSLINFR